MKKLLGVLACVALVAGCDDQRPPVDYLDGNAGSTPHTKPVAPEPNAREVAVYEAIVRELVVEQPNSPGDGVPFRRIFIVDGPVGGAGRPLTDDGPPERRFEPPLKRALEDELSDLPPVEFVEDADSVRRGEDGMAGARGRGVIVTLGPIEGKVGRVEVPNSMWVNGLYGQWQTYVVEKRRGAWKVTGTTGPMAIS